MTREQAIEHGNSQLEVFGGEHREFIKLALQKLQEETVSRESYEHEYFLRKELELKVAKLEKQIAEDNSCEPNKSEIPTGSTTKNDLVTIHIEGLDEEIRCVMCSKWMYTTSIL